MEKLSKLIDRIIDRVNINLRETGYDVGDYIRDLVPMDQLAKIYAFYGLTSLHPLRFHFSDSCLAGSYFLGKCFVDHSILYESDIRGDELKSKNQIYQYEGLDIPLHDDEVIRIRDSYLMNTLVHNYSHDPENPEEFLIQNVVSMPYTNIHGAPTEGCFLGPFSTLDLTTVHNCVIGSYAYVQVDELSHHLVPPGQIWIKAMNLFDFSYLYPTEVLERYIRLNPGNFPQGIFMEFAKQHKGDFQSIFDSVSTGEHMERPHGTAVSRYAVVKGDSRIGENVLVAQRAYVEESSLGHGANAQENCYIIHSNLQGLNVTAHGGKIIHAQLEEKVFVGFNSFLRGDAENTLRIGENSIVMPHTIIDLEQPLEIPSNQLIWGYIRNGEDLQNHSISFDRLMKVNGELKIGSLLFRGDGSQFVQAFRHRIEHILEANGAYFNGVKNMGHSQRGQKISFNTIEPYREGPLAGLCPTIDIRP